MNDKEVDQKKLGGYGEIQGDCAVKERKCEFEERQS